MPVSDPIIEASKNELLAIFSWTADGRKERRLILIGGWAVYHYNPYYGSVDIDLISSSKTRKRLTTYLRSERGFEYERRSNIDDRVLCKVIDGKRIDIDFGTMETDDRFEGRPESLSMDILNGRTKIWKFGSTNVEIPEISLLLIFKCKAAHDRNDRLEKGRSLDPEWERSKLIKDLSDIIALLDSEETMDLLFLGGFFKERAFLVPVLDLIEENPECIEKYGSDRMHVDEILKRFRSLAL